MYCFLPEGRTTTRLVDDFIRSATTGQHYVKASAKDAVQTPSKRGGGQEQSKYGSFTIITIRSFYLLVVWTWAKCVYCYWCAVNQCTTAQCWISTVVLLVCSVARLVYTVVLLVSTVVLLVSTVCRGYNDQTIAIYCVKGYYIVTVLSYLHVPLCFWGTTVLRSTAGSKRLLILNAPIENPMYPPF